MKPNVVMLLLDATRADHLSCYGYDRETTPFLEDLAAESVVYDRAYASSIWTLPSCSSLFTGKYPSEHGVVDWGKKIRDTTFMDNLQKTGYSTHTISAHIGASDGFGIADSFDTRTRIENRSRGFLFEDDPVFEEMEERRKADTYDSTVSRYLAAAHLALSKRSLKSIPNAVYHQYQMLRRRRGFWTDNGASETLSRAQSLVTEADSP
ncbi:sulfatase-like hydrolase/transferase [Haloarcula rara]|nr:sulfatase-like hydrolase/transferase [Halomicroarcula sp. SHR3]